MKKLARSLVAVALAGLSVPTAPPPVAAVAQQRSITAPRPAENQKTTPTRAATDNTVRYNRDLLSGGYEQVFSSPCVWPHNRPQRGWRKVQSRRRHNERMRRQRRNA